MATHGVPVPVDALGFEVDPVVGDAGDAVRPLDALPLLLTLQPAEGATHPRVIPQTVVERERVAETQDQGSSEVLKGALPEGGDPVEVHSEKPHGI